MVPKRLDLDVNTLHRENRCVRALARSLVADPNLAEDLAQRAWVAALRNPPSQVAALRAWLATTVRRLAFRHFAADRTRRRHESELARRGRPPPLEIVLENEAVRRRVVEALVALPRSYSEVIALRYFDEVPPAEIARRLGIPGGSVRSRLSRGLALMRERLRADFDKDQRGWLAALSPLARLAPGVGGESALFAWKFATALLLLGGLFSFEAWFGETRSVQQATTVSVTESATNDSQSVFDRPKELVRTRVGSRGGSRIPLVRVLHADGSPAAGLRYVVGRHDPEHQLIPETTEALGLGGEIAERLPARRDPSANRLWVEIHAALTVEFSMSGIREGAQDANFKLPRLERVDFVVAGVDPGEQWRVRCVPIVAWPSQVAPYGLSATPGPWSEERPSEALRIVSAVTWISGVGRELGHLDVIPNQPYRATAKAERHALNEAAMNVRGAALVRFTVGERQPAIHVRMLDPDGAAASIRADYCITGSSRGAEPLQGRFEHGATRIGFGDLRIGDRIQLTVRSEAGEVFYRQFGLGDSRVQSVDLQTGQGSGPAWLPLDPPVHSKTNWRGWFDSSPTVVRGSQEIPCDAGPALCHPAPHQIALYRIPSATTEGWLSGSGGQLLHLVRSSGESNWSATRIEDSEVVVNLPAVCQGPSSISCEIQLPMSRGSRWVSIGETAFDGSPRVADWRCRVASTLPTRITIDRAGTGPETFCPRLTPAAVVTGPPNSNPICIYPRESLR